MFSCLCETYVILCEICWALINGISSVQINTRMEQCGKVVSCNCGVAVMAEDDVIVIDRCRREKRNLAQGKSFPDGWNTIHRHALEQGESFVDGLKLFEHDEGRRYTVSQLCSAFAMSSYLLPDDSGRAIRMGRWLIVLVLSSLFWGYEYDGKLKIYCWAQKTKRRGCLFDWYIDYASGERCIHLGNTLHRVWQVTENLLSATQKNKIRDCLIWLIYIDYASVERCVNLENTLQRVIDGTSKQCDKWAVTKLSSFNASNQSMYEFVLIQSIHIAPREKIFNQRCFYPSPGHRKRFKCWWKIHVAWIPD